MNEDKVIKVNGKDVKVSQVKHWKFDKELDLPERSVINSERFNALEIVWRAWRELSVEGIEEALADNFQYSSYWVTNDTLNKERYLDYLKGKFKTIGETKAVPDVKIVVIREAIFPQNYAYALHITQRDVEALLTFAFNGNKISEMAMTDPDLFDFDLINMRAYFLTPVCEANQEPLLIENKSDKAGEQMFREDFFAFAIEAVEFLMSRGDVEIVSTLKKEDTEYPNVVTHEKGEKVYYKVVPSVVFEPIVRHPKGLEDFLRFCEKQKARPVLVNIAMFCIDNAEGQPEYGGHFAMQVRLVSFD